jgi:hypothetical protein
VFDGGNLIADRLEQIEERGVHENDLILGVIDYVGQLIAGQAQIQGVHDGAIARDGEVQLQMAEAVPAERADAVARLDAKTGQDMGERMNAAVKVGVGIAVHAVGSFAHDFLAREQFGGTLQEVGERERVVHHEALHRGILLYDGGMLIFKHRLPHGRGSVALFPSRERKRPVLGPKVGALKNALRGPANIGRDAGCQKYPARKGKTPTT